MVGARVERVGIGEEQEKVIAARIRAGKAARDERMRCADPVDREHFSSVSERNLAMVRGTYWSKRYPNDRTRRHRNHIGPALAVKHDLITSGTTEFELDATEQRFVPFQEQAQAILNHAWTALSFDEQCKAAQWDSGVHGFGAVEVGWDYMRGAPTEQADDAEVEANIRSAKPARDAAPVRDDPFVERFDPRTLIVDPQCSSYTLKDARFAFREKREVLERVKQNPRYADTGNLHGDVGKWHAGSDKPGDEQFGAAVESDFRLITLYDGYVLLDLDGSGADTMLHVVMTNESDKPLLVETVPFSFPNCGNPFPFEVLPCWVVDNDEFMPEADVSQAAQRQRANDEAVTQLDNKRASLMDILMAPDAIFQGDSGQANKEILEGRRNGVLRIPQGMHQFIQWLGTPSLNMEVYREVEMAANDIKQLIGVSDYQLNSTPAGRDMLATEVLAMKEQGGTRQTADIETYSSFKCRIAYKVLVLMQVFGNRSRQYRFTTRGGDVKWGEAVPMVAMRGTVADAQSSGGLDPIASGLLERPGVQWQVRVSASSVAQKNRFIDRQEKLKLLEIAGQYAGTPNAAGQPLINMPALLRAVFQTFDLPTMAEIIPPDPPSGGAPMPPMRPMAAPPTAGAPAGMTPDIRLPGSPPDPGQIMGQLAARERSGPA